MYIVDHLQGVLIDTFNKLNQTADPTFHSVLVGFEVKNMVILKVEQEQWNYHKGNCKEDFTVSIKASSGDL